MVIYGGLQTNKKGDVRYLKCRSLWRVLWWAAFSKAQERTGWPKK